MKGEDFFPHFNENLLCAIDVETTGLDPFNDEIVQLGMLPLTVDFEPNPRYQFVNVFIKPSHEYEYYAKNPDLTPAKRSIKRACEEGLPPSLVRDMLDLWFDNEIVKVGQVRKLQPLAQNWPFDKGFMVNFFGPQNFERMFHPYYRDTMAAGLFCNDIAAWKGERIPFPKLNLAYLVGAHGIERTPVHDALEDCVLTARMYHIMMKCYSDLRRLDIPVRQPLPVIPVGMKEFIFS